jgi:imidazolonepropionase-like amidohydrolase
MSKEVRAGIILLAALLVLVRPVQADTLALVGGTIIDGTGRAPLENGVLLIRDGRIIDIGRSRDVKIPESAQKLDARGRYVIPGLMDAVNLTWFPMDLESLIRYEGRYHELFLEASQIALKSGITTAFAMRRGHAAPMKARDMINAGEAPGARIFVAGIAFGVYGRFAVVPPQFAAGRYATPDPEAKYLSRSFVQRINGDWEQGSGGPESMGPELLWMTPEQVRAVVRDYVRTQRVDYLKYAGNDVYEAGIAFSPRVQKAIVEEGHRAGLTVQVHTMSEEATDLALDAGVDILTHGDRSGPMNPFHEATIRKMLERKVFVGVLPQTQRYLDAREKTDSQSYDINRFKIAKINRGRMIKAGVPLLLGNEASIRTPQQLAELPDLPELSFGGKLGEAHIHALMALEEEGMKPMELLKTATSNVAKAYKLAELGTLEPGKLADVVILDADPLKSARNYKQVHAVIRDGRIVDLNALPLNPLITQ